MPQVEAKEERLSELVETFAQKIAEEVYNDDPNFDVDSFEEDLLTSVLELANPKETVWYNSGTYGSLVQRLQREKPTDPVASSIWCKGDVEGMVEEYNEENDTDLTLTDEEIADVLSQVDNSTDCEVGINWESIRYAVACVIDDRN